MIALSCGIKISAVRHFFSFVTMHACDRETDRRTDRITTPKTALAYARAVKIKNGGLDQYGAEPFEQQQFGTGLALKGLISDTPHLLWCCLCESLIRYINSLGTGS